jgi:hypothetical protein
MSGSRCSDSTIMLDPIFPVLSAHTCISVLVCGAKKATLQMRACIENSRFVDTLGAAFNT